MIALALALSRWEKIQIIAGLVGTGVGIWSTVTERRAQAKETEKDRVIEAMAAHIRKLEAKVKGTRGKR
jgi:hypothetical protein